MSSSKLNLNNYAKAGGSVFAAEILQLHPLTWLGVMLTAIMIFALDYLGITTPLTNAIEYIVQPSRSSSYQAYIRLEQLNSGFKNLPDLVKKNAELEAEVAKLNSRLAEVEAVFNENEELQKQTGIKYEADYEQIGAFVLGANANRPGEYNLNKGTENGVQVGDIVVIEKIVVGKIVTATSFSSTLQTVLSASSSIPVKTNVASLGIMKSRNANELVVEQILQSTEVKQGDLVFTSGLNNEFPPNLFVGEVSSIESDPRASTKLAVLKPSISYQKLERVIILSNKDQ